MNTVVSKPKANESKNLNKDKKFNNQSLHPFPMLLRDQRMLDSFDPNITTKQGRLSSKLRLKFDESNENTFEDCIETSMVDLQIKPLLKPPFALI